MKESALDLHVDRIERRLASVEDQIAQLINPSLGDLKRSLIDVKATVQRLVDLRANT